MKAKTKFMKMFYKLPKKARIELACGCLGHQMTLNFVASELRKDTKYGYLLLEQLGYEDD